VARDELDQIGCNRIVGGPTRQRYRAVVGNGGFSRQFFNCQKLLLNDSVIFLFCESARNNRRRGEFLFESFVKKPQIFERSLFSLQNSNMCNLFQNQKSTTC
jgi:hypothetical protein